MIDGHRNRDTIYMVVLGLLLSALFAVAFSVIDAFTSAG
jgi:hypothetical protein